MYRVVLVWVAFVASTKSLSVDAQYDVIVVGMGAAGCAAASTLAQAGKKILALDAQDRIGGRVHTVPFGEGIIELGAEWIHGTESSRVYDLAVKNNVTILAEELQFKVYQSDGSIPDVNLINDLLNISLAVQDERPEVPEPLGHFITRRLKEYLKENNPQVLKNEVFVDEVLDFVDLVVNGYEGSDSWNDVTTHSDYEQLEGNDRMSWHRNGYHTLFDILLNKYNDGPGYPRLQIELQKEVSQISWSSAPGRAVRVTCADGTQYTATHVIVTLSLGVLKERYKTLFLPELPQNKTIAIETLSIGVVDKIALSFAEKWWGTTNDVGFIWKKEDVDKLSKDDKWLKKLNGISMPMGSDNVIVFWPGGEEAKLAETLPEEVVKTKVMEVLRRFMGRNLTIPEPVSILRSTWYSNPYTRGSYTYDNVNAPLHPTARSELAAPLVDAAGVPRVLFAGEAAHPHHFSTVHGAVETGYREAKRLLPTKN